MADPFADLVPKTGTKPQAFDNTDPFADLIPAAGKGEMRAPSAAEDFWSSKAGRLVQGAAEPVVGLGQLAAHATGVGADYMDQLAREQHEAYQASRARAGISPEDWDYWAGIGSIVSPINLVPGGIVGRAVGPAKTIAGMMGRGAGIGAGIGAMQPVTGAPEAYPKQKFQQVATGALVGAAAEPAIHGAGKVIKKALQPLTKAGRTRAAADRLEYLARERGEDVAKKLVFQLFLGPQEKKMEQERRANFFTLILVCSCQIDMYHSFYCL